MFGGIRPGIPETCPEIIGIFSYLKTFHSLMEFHSLGELSYVDILCRYLMYISLFYLILDFVWLLNLVGGWRCLHLVKVGTITTMLLSIQLDMD